MSETKVQSPPPPWEARVRQVLRREIKIDEAVRLPAADRTEGYDPEVFRADLKLLNNLNEIYIKTKSWRVVEFGMPILGGPGRILHLGEGKDWEMYAAAAENEGRLITPMELRSMMDDNELLDVEESSGLGPAEEEKATVEEVTKEPEGPEASAPKVEPVSSAPAQPVEVVQAGPASVDEGEAGLSTKALVLGRSSGHPYRRICEIESRIMNAREYCEYVAQKGTGLEVRRECRLQLSMELQTVDELLARLERNRDEDTRNALVKEILIEALKYHLVKGQRLYSRAYVEEYPDEFPLEEISKFSTKVKCEGDCLACKNFVHTLVKPGPSYTRY
jgi:hypothetical protein